MRVREEVRSEGFSPGWGWEASSEQDEDPVTGHRRWQNRRPPGASLLLILT